MVLSRHIEGRDHRLYVHVLLSGRMAHTVYIISIEVRLVSVSRECSVIVKACTIQEHVRDIISIAVERRERHVQKHRQMGFPGSRTDVPTHEIPRLASADSGRQTRQPSREVFEAVDFGPPR
ncbi:uncharacterized protein LAESUDRAFT_311821 [Laetiporus sulphureus 93-53]|uniref:Uncharacterized protein n=1 Tax=Laetiporus sulphureus 93-53 TaxID=1314785 RepID=A0A165D4S6_9APHY|nr:uncharacterized protein LAESUDRAFT_311821 [Laetiporus sulphureus 93-53]KZT04150.1 hypothetical protein LAESUDRAFT_311821 [Laetiporus sulphureus 93-53]